jgi:hypothetical protein
MGPEWLKILEAMTMPRQPTERQLRVVGAIANKVSMAGGELRSRQAIATALALMEEGHD